MLLVKRDETDSNAPPARAPHDEISPERLAAATRRSEELEKQIIELCGHLNAAEYRFLELVAEFDRDQHWARWYGVASCAHWLSWQCGFGMHAARERVRVARALGNLPQISELFARGEICYSKVREMTRVATPDNEELLVTVAKFGTTTHIERLVRSYRRFERLEEAERADEQYRQRHVHYRYDEDGSVIIHAKLPPEVGEAVINAIDAAVEALYQDGMQKRSCASGPEASDEIQTQSNVPAGTWEQPSEPDPWAPYRSVPGVSAVEEHEDQSWVDSLGTRRADALRLIAEQYLSGDTKSRASSGDRYQVVVHIDQALLSGSLSASRCELDNGYALAIDTARRLACDGSLVGIVENEDREPLDVGRKTRSIPPSIARALKARDGGCRFPGCARTRFTDGHHIRHWADGGETKLSNLVTLCDFHHRLMHEGGFDVRRTDDGAFLFTRPDGSRVEENGRSRAIELGVGFNGRARSSETGEPTLFAINRRLGLDIDARTAACRWTGERMDYSSAVGWMADVRDRARMT